MRRSIFWAAQLQALVVAGLMVGGSALIFQITESQTQWQQQQVINQYKLINN